MSQQEFEPRERQSSSEWRWKEGRPKDEPAGAYGMPEGQARQEDARQEQASVPWWARPQPQQGDSLRFIAIIVLAVLIIFILGGMGIIGLVLGALAHLVGIVLGALFVMVLFALALGAFLFALIRRAIWRATGYDRSSWRAQRRAMRRSWRGPRY